MALVKSPNDFSSKLKEMKGCGQVTEANTFDFYKHKICHIKSLDKNRHLQI